MQLKDLVKTERIKRGLTFSEAAEIIGINRFYYSEIENGRICGMKTLKKIAVFCHKDYSEVRMIVDAHENN